MVYSLYARVRFTTQNPDSGNRSLGLLLAVTMAILICVPQINADPQSDETSDKVAQAQSGPTLTVVVEEPLSAIHLPPQELNSVAPSARPAFTSEYWRRLAAKYDVSKIGQRGVGKGLNMYSIEREQAMGKRLSERIDAETRLLEDPIIVQYVNNIGQKLVRNSDAKVPFTIKVIDSNEVNAFALPGGYFYVNAGLILAADNEAQLAGVMAHEIAHVAARHVTRNATRTQMMNIVSVPLIGIAGPAGFAVRELVVVGGPLSSLKFTRDAEREADLLGIEYEYAAGYDPLEFIHFFEKLKLDRHAKTSRVARAFATHPMSDERIRRAQEEISNLLPPRDQYVISTSEFETVKARLARLEHLGDINASGGEVPVLRTRTHRDQQDDAPGEPTLRTHPQ